MRPIHFVGYINPAEAKSWAACGKLVPLSATYMGDEPGDRVTCLGCLKVLAAQDRKMTA